MSGPLCDRCVAFKNWRASEAQKWFQSAKFRHWATGTLLDASAAKRCHLCMLIQQALLRSERPDGEPALPDRQILLSLAPSDLTMRGLRIDVKIEPESLETAGRPKFSSSLKPGFTVISGGAKDRFKSIMRSQGNWGSDQFWIADHSGEYEYYRGGKEISSAEFWAVINPYHSTDIEIYPLSGKSSQDLL
jgi:hypothetical protein